MGARTRTFIKMGGEISQYITDLGDDLRLTDEEKREIWSEKWDPARDSGRNSEHSEESSPKNNNNTSGGGNEALGTSGKAGQGTSSSTSADAVRKKSSGGSSSRKSAKDQDEESGSRLTSPSRQKRDRVFHKFADRMILSDPRRDFQLPYVTPNNQRKRGIPIRYYAHHPQLRWQWEEEGETVYAELIGAKKRT